MFLICKVSKGAKIQNRYNQVPHLRECDKLTVRHHKSLKYNKIKLASAYTHWLKNRGILLDI